MSEFEIARRFQASVEQVSAFVSWQGMPRLTAGGFFTSAVFPKGDAPVAGSMRVVGTPDGGSFTEELIEEVAGERFFQRYRLIDTGPFPLTDYEGVVVVTKAGDGCCLKFGHRATMVESSAEIWRENWAVIEGQVFDYIEQQLSAG